MAPPHRVHRIAVGGDVAPEAPLVPQNTCDMLSEVRSRIHVRRRIKQGSPEELSVLSVRPVRSRRPGPPAAHTPWRNSLLPHIG